MAALDDLQGGDEFRVEHLLAARHEGLGAEHLESAVGYPGRAEARFAPPAGEHDAGRHAVTLLDRPQCGGKPAGTGAAAGNDAGYMVEIGGRSAELRLMLLLRRGRLLSR